MWIQKSLKDRLTGRHTPLPTQLGYGWVTA
jgi:hypothetical protein